MNWQKIFSAPEFWENFIKVALVTTEKAAPNYTVGHKAAAIVDHFLGGSPISTPDAAHAENLVQALGEGVKAVFASAIQVGTK